MIIVIQALGITYDTVNQRFLFDFEHDGVNDLISLTGDGYQVDAFGKCFYYGYEFEPEVDSSVRTSFIQYVKFYPSIQKDEDLSHSIQKAVNDLNAQINLYNGDLSTIFQSSESVYAEIHLPIRAADTQVKKSKQHNNRGTSLS